MKRVLIGFRDDKLLQSITVEVNRVGGEPLEFIQKATKASILSEIAEGGYDVVMLKEQMSNGEIWSKEELISIKDSYNIHLLPLIPDTYFGKQVLVDFANVGLNSAVLLRNDVGYKPNEIVNVLYSPRTPKEARSYYGIERLSDITEGRADVLSEVVFEEARGKLLQAAPDLIGKQLIMVVSDWTTGQTIDFLSRLDGETTRELQKTLEYYDILEILKKNEPRRKIRFTVPKDIKRRQKERDRELKKKKRAGEKEDIYIGDEALQDGEVFIEKGVIDGKYRDYDEEEGIDLEEAEISFGDEEYDDTLSDDEMSFAEEKPMGMLIAEEDDFSFDDGQQTAAGGKPSAEKKDEKPEDANTKKEGKREKRTKRIEGDGSPRIKHLTLDDVGGDEDKKKEDSNLALIIGVVIGIIVLLTLLAVIFIFITGKLKLQRMAEQATEGYDQLYNPEDVASYELTENGSPVLRDEEGNVLYDGSDPANVVTPEEEMDWTIGTEEEQENECAAVQEFNDPSAFTDGAVYKGLDLINALNGTQGADCTLYMKNGAVVEVPRGEASIEDFKPSATYTCKTDGTVLSFTEN